MSYNTHDNNSSFRRTQWCNNGKYQCCYASRGKCSLTYEDRCGGYLEDYCPPNSALVQEKKEKKHDVRNFGNIF